MAVTFEFVIEKGFHFAHEFGQRFNMSVKDNRVSLPQSLGTGYIQEIALREGLSLCLHRYKLNQGFLLRRLESAGLPETLTLKFDCRKVAQEHATYLFAPGCEAELGTGNFFTEVFFSEQKEICFLVINISRKLLVELLQLGDNDIDMRNLLLFNPSFVFNVLMSGDMEYTLKQFSSISTSSPHFHLLYQSKTLELIYHFFAKLTVIVPNKEVSVNRADCLVLNEVDRF